MDFSKFSDENFEVKDWINNALKAHKDAGVSLDTHASNLVMKLQLFIQEVNKSLEETSQIAVNNLPRVLREVEGIKADASSLKEQMQMVKDDIKQIDENTSQSMKMLVEIDSIKERMQAASHALQQADNWTTLSADVDEIFKTGDVEEISEKLIGMQQSLLVLEDVPDFAERRRFLESLKNRLEALLSTKLVTAFNGHKLDEAKRYVEIFTEIDRFSQLQTYYNNCHRGNLNKIWNELREDPNNDVTTWLPKFYDNLVSLWHNEIAWCGQVFADPVAVLSSLLIQILVHLEPPISECITENLNGEEASLELLIQLKQISFRLISALESATKSLPSNISSPNSIVALVKTIEEPYLEYRLRYSELQQTELIAGIDQMKLDISGFSDTVASMSESVGLAFRLAEEAKTRCWQFTDAFGTMGLMNALQNFFSAYLGKLDYMINDLRKNCEIDTTSKKASSNFDEEDQWTNFQNAFKLIEMCGQLLVRTSDFREIMTKEIKEKLALINGADDRVSASQNYLKVNRPMEFEELQELDVRVNSYDVNVILASTQDQVERLNEHAQKFAFDVVFVHLRRQLEEIPHLKVWSKKSKTSEAITEDLPTFSLSPQGCITQVGDYLLTLPQQLEPFFTHENTSLKVALKTGQIPYTDKQDAEVEHDHHWVMGFARGTMMLFVENILKIPELSTDHATQQLIADIDYLCNIFEAVEVHANDQLRSIRELLQVDKTRFHERAAELSTDSLIEDKIAKIRNI